MKTHVLDVNIPSKSYDIIISADFSELPEKLKQVNLCGRTALIVTDSNVEPLYANKVKGIIQTVCPCETVVIEAGEENKTLATIEKIYSAAIKAGLDRKSFLVALGGGVTGDMTGFAAASYMRGIKFVQLPTTLLAAVDASVGGKTAVDFGGVKNCVGAFYQPKFVYMNVSTLATLPEKELLSGLAESLKHGLIADKDYFDYICENRTALLDYNETVLTEVILRSCVIKSNIVSADEKESGIRAFLNLGHTFGHAVESLSGYKVTHGHCVSVGVICACAVSCKLGNISEKEFYYIKDKLSLLGLPIDLHDKIFENMSFSEEEIFDKMLTDKKNENGKINLVIPEKLGSVYILKDADKELIKIGIRAIL
ncbi:MAG: 3-dehydroquinate synthase [Clostridiales bacterium]|jgi:3-dehydroquinate synthase|nr:3-dehydroquinate synthase [Clostridiales bacterium]